MEAFRKWNKFSMKLMKKILSISLSIISISMMTRLAVGGHVTYMVGGRPKNK